MKISYITIFSNLWLNTHKHRSSAKYASLPKLWFTDCKCSLHSIQMYIYFWPYNACKLVHKQKFYSIHFVHTLSTCRQIQYCVLWRYIFIMNAVPKSCDSWSLQAKCHAGNSFCPPGFWFQLLQELCSYPCDTSGRAACVLRYSLLPQMMFAQITI